MQSRHAVGANHIQSRKMITQTPKSTRQLLIFLHMFSHHLVLQLFAHHNISPAHWVSCIPPISIIHAMPCPIYDIPEGRKERQNALAMHTSVLYDTTLDFNLLLKTFPQGSGRLIRQLNSVVLGSPRFLIAG
jgi:hypothetical protein